MMKKENYLVSNPNCHRVKWFSENELAIEIKTSKGVVIKPFFLGFITPDLSKIKMYE